MNRKTVERFIPVAKAIADAEFEDWWQFRHVSIIISNKSIISVGTNVKKTHTFNKFNGYLESYLHSEMAAYVKIQYMKGRFTLLNFRFSKTGEIRMSKPCKYCLPLCLELFDEVWYSTNNGMVKL